MKHNLPELPYSAESFGTKLSKESFDYHYGKHFQTYIDNLNKLIEGTVYEELPLDEIVKKSTGAIYNNAAQAWNHGFFFETLTPAAVKMPVTLESKITRDLGSVEKFKEDFTKAAVGLFGSGWAWLVENQYGKLEIVQEPNAGNPLTHGQKPLLTIDVWEHAYYIDYRNRRAAYVEAYWDMIDWNKVADRL